MKDVDLVSELKKHFNIPDSEDIKITFFFTGKIYSFRVDSNSDEYLDYTGVYFYIPSENRFTRPAIN